jgi:hypothetical protein
VKNQSRNNVYQKTRPPYNRVVGKLINIRAYFFLRKREVQMLRGGFTSLIAVACVALFVGLAVMPGVMVDAVKADLEEKYVEVTSEAFGDMGCGNHTVRLTIDQYHALQQYLVSFQARVNRSSSSAETFQLYHEAFQELSQYGLLPAGMSAFDAETRLDDSHLPVHQVRQSMGTKSDSLKNYLSWVVGWVDKAPIFAGGCSYLGVGLEGLSIYALIILYIYWGNGGIFNLIVPILGSFFLILCLIGGVFESIGLVLDFLTNTIGGPRVLSCVSMKSAEGSIVTQGVNGKLSIYGYLTGKIAGFSGLLIRGIDTKFLIGRAMIVDVTN